LELISPAAAATESRNPRTGELFWTARTGGMNSSSRPIYRDGLVYVFNGMGSMSAIKPGGTGDVDKTHIAWARRKVVAKKSSPLLLDGLLYMTSDEGVASCSNPQTGEIIWAERLGGKGQYAASPIHANGHIYFSSSEGDFPVLKAGRKFEIISRNKLDAGCMASPAIVGNALVIRTKTHVYRIEKSS
jgi:outer membrane protein assembly factor BamB